MVKSILFFLSLLFSITVFSQNRNQFQKDELKMNIFINDLMKKMTLAEKVGQMNLPTVGFDVTGPLLSEGV
ncbi:MAG: hypothetical protein ABI266_07855, partial [Ginsengibacter sp.]